MRRQHSRRRATQRLLLLAAATTAGIGISLALSDDAHAVDHTPPPDVTAALRQLPDTRATPPSQKTPSPRPARRAERTARIADKAASATTDTIERATPRADPVTEPAPVAGRTVSRVTTVSDRLSGTAVGMSPPLPRPPALPRPAAIDVPIQLPRDRAAAIGPQTAPELTESGAPMLLAVNSGASTPTTSLRREQPRRHHTCRPDGGRDAASSSTSTPSRLVGGGHLAHGGGAVTASMPSVHPAAAAFTDHWPGAYRWQQAVVSYIHTRTGRIPPPAPPSG